MQKKIAIQNPTLNTRFQLFLSISTDHSIGKTVNEVHSSYPDSGNLEIMVQDLEDSGQCGQTLTGQITLSLS